MKLTPIRPEWLFSLVAQWQYAANTLGSGEVADRHDLVRTFCQTVPPAQTALEQLILRGAVAEIKLKAWQACRTSIQLGPTVEDPRIADAIAYLTNNLRNDALTEDLVALQIGLSRSHFSRLFTRSVGMPFREYLKALRVRAALSVMDSPDGHRKSVKEIAGEVGYRTSGAFCRHFKAACGAAPNAYRRRQRRLLAE